MLGINFAKGLEFSVEIPRLSLGMTRVMAIDPTCASCSFPVGQVSNLPLRAKCRLDIV